MTDISKPSPTLPVTVRYMLFASVALNLFLAGLWLGTIGQRVLTPAAPEHGQFSARIARMLDETDKAKFSQDLVQLDAAASEGWASMDKARARIVSVMRAETFDADAFAGALASFHDQEGRMRSAIDRQISAVLSQLSQHARSSVAEEMFSRRPPFAPPPPRD